MEDVNVEGECKGDDGGSMKGVMFRMIKKKTI